MTQEMDFAARLEKIKQLARNQGGMIQEKQVRDAFADMHFDEGQMKLVFDYLAGQKIGIGEPLNPEDYLSEKYITKEEMLDVLSDAVPRSNILKGSIVAMDGFTGFTPVQDRLLGELLKVCGKVMITVEMDEREDPFVYRHPYQLFALSKQMVTSLVKIARDTKTEMEDPVYLYQKPPKRFEHNAELAFLESELFRYSGKQYLREDEPGDERSGYTGAVSLHEARNPRTEAKYVAEGIRYLVREKGYRYRDIAVITADMNVYADALEKACGLFDIPVFMDHKKSRKFHL